MVTSNLAEIANSLLVPVRALPLKDLLSGIYEHQQEKFHARAEEAMAWKGSITPTATKFLHRSCEDARTMHVVPSSMLSGLVRDAHRGYEVLLPGSINAPQGWCSCGRFQQLLRPCAHAAALSLYHKQPPLQQVHSGYNTATWRATYGKKYAPIATDNLAHDMSFEPPELISKKGRPRTKRMEKGKQAGKDAGGQYLCSICRGTGHKRKDCAIVHMF
ncbi:hypothetical protein V8E36_005455 [Tilletia maclaganii]